MISPTRLNDILNAKFITPQEGEEHVGEPGRPWISTLIFTAVQIYKTTFTSVLQGESLQDLALQIRNWQKNEPWSKLLDMLHDYIQTNLPEDISQTEVIMIWLTDLGWLLQYIAEQLDSNWIAPTASRTLPELVDGMRMASTIINNQIQEIQNAAITQQVGASGKMSTKKKKNAAKSGGAFVHHTEDETKFLEMTNLLYDICTSMQDQLTMSEDETSFNLTSQQIQERLDRVLGLIYGLDFSGNEDESLFDIIQIVATKLPEKTEGERTIVKMLDDLLNGKRHLAV